MFQRFCFVLCLFVPSTFFAVGEDLPYLSVPGFSWAENLVFDGIGNMFVSDAVRSELWRIYLCENRTEYCHNVHLSEGLKGIGGIQVSEDGLTLYAGATLRNKSYALISTSTSESHGRFEIVALTKNKPNGLAYDYERNVLYFTDEGTGSDEGGTITAFDLSTNIQTTIKDFVPGADGAWMDNENKLLYVGELLTMHVLVFNTSGISASSAPVLVGEFDAFAPLGGLPHMLDDFTLDKASSSPLSSSTSSLGQNILIGTDWTGRAVVKCSLDGTSFPPETIPPPEGVTLYEPTSVRWGKGPGFDSNSLYVTEGGGVLPSQTNRRVVQIKV